MDLSLIPEGDYCYKIRHIDNDKGTIYIDPCPYWRNRKDIDNIRTDEQDYGYCLYLNKGDIELNEEYGISLLWDQCKMCDINIVGDEEL